MGNVLRYCQLFPNLWEIVPRENVGNYNGFNIPTQELIK